MYKLLEQLLENEGISAYRMCKDTGIATATISEWKSGRSTPKKEKIQKIADYFGVPLSYFYGTPTDETTLSSKEKELIEIYNELNEEGKQLLLERASELQKLGYIKNSKSGVVSA